MRNRDKSDELLSRFLTTAMLAKLAKINKERRILFIVATNYIQNFDIAISRLGRFDLVFQMMSPKASEKLAFPRWREDLRWLQGVVCDGFEEGLARLTYLETDKLVSKLNGDLGPQRDKRDGGLARAYWNKTLEGCTLARPNEQSQRMVSDTGTADAASTGATPAGRYLTWQEVAIDEARYIRED